MQNALVTVEEASDLIRSGAVCLFAGSEEALSRLPRGAWIGGTSVYFLTEEGGIVDRERVFATRISEATAARPLWVSPADLPTLSEARFAEGFTAILIPAFSEAHTAFAMEAARYDGVFDQPLLGWIAGVHLDEIGQVKPKVFDGATGLSHDEGACLLHVELATGTPAQLDIVNIFEQGDEHVFVFENNGFEAQTVKINGRDENLAAYIVASGMDTRLPLVANYAGALINVSIQEVDAQAGRVKFYAPVVAGVEYRLARVLENYVDAFAERLSGEGAEEFSCNCILNYLYGELEGRRTGDYTGPVTFGEIAYMLLNQTMVRLHVGDAA